MLRLLSPLVLAITVAVAHAQSPNLERRRQILDELLKVLNPSRPPAVGRMNASDRTWEDWVRRTGDEVGRLPRRQRVTAAVLPAVPLRSGTEPRDGEL